MVKQWQEKARRLIGQFGIFDLWEIERESPRTKQTRPYLAMQADDWCNVIPITPEGNVVLIHQFRHGIADVTIEIPGGIVDPYEADPAAAAERELMEETGYSAEKIIKLGVVETNPAIFNNHCHLYLALGARPTHTQELGQGEDIFVEEVPLAQAKAYVKSGKIQHCLTVSAFHYFSLWEAENQNTHML